MPAEGGFEPRIPYTRVLIILMCIIVPVSIYGLYTISQANSSMEETIGLQFKALADSNAHEISVFVHDRVAEAAMFAAAPVVAQTVQTANARYRGMSDAAIQQRIQNIEADWNKPAGDAWAKEIVGNEASNYLRNMLKLDPRFLRMTVTDERGATVAATHKTLDYYQADEEFWQGIYAGGRGAVSVTDVLHDELTRANYIGIGVPIVEPGTERLIGTLDALVDVSMVSQIVQRSSLGPNSRVSLVKADGTIISAPNTTLAMKMHSEDFDAVSELLATQAGRNKGYVVAAFPRGGEHLVAVSDTGLKADYKLLDWYVLVAQDTRQAFAPIRSANTLISFVALAGLVFITLLFVVYDLHRKRSYVDIEEATGEAALKGAATR
jgi:hypothetical protein